MNQKIKKKEMDELFSAVLSLQDLDDCYAFFEDLCTISELLAMEQRFQVAKMLNAGTIYSDIVKKTGASTATISRVNRCLSYGSDGYKRALQRIKDDASV